MGYWSRTTFGSLSSSPVVMFSATPLRRYTGMYTHTMVKFSNISSRNLGKGGILIRPRDIGPFEQWDKLALYFDPQFLFEIEKEKERGPWLPGRYTVTAP